MKYLKVIEHKDCVCHVYEPHDATSWIEQRKKAKRSNICSASGEHLDDESGFYLFITSINRPMSFPNCHVNKKYIDIVGFEDCIEKLCDIYGKFLEYRSLVKKHFPDSLSDHL